MYKSLVVYFCNNGNHNNNAIYLCDKTGNIWDVTQVSVIGYIKFIYRNKYQQEML